MQTKVSEKAKNLIGSEIIKLAAEINEQIRQGQSIHNFTIGDFDPAVFPIPESLNTFIQEAYAQGITNYPAADGEKVLREAVQAFMEKHGGLAYALPEILIAGGARPLIYAIYQALVNPGEKVWYPVPSWNNNHYTYLVGGQPIEIATVPEQNFMPQAADLAPYIQEVALVALCSPLNPTGTTFSASELAEICDVILAENTRRGPDAKPVYLMYDQIYWLLTQPGIQHVDPVTLRPEMKAYTIYVDGLSKGFAATGVRVGWSLGPESVISKMKSILGHVGAWAPKAEQIAVAQFLRNTDAVTNYLHWIKEATGERLTGFYNGIQALKAQGYPVDAIPPQGAIYLTLQFALKGKKTPNGHVLQTTADVTAYLLSAAGFAIVPFYAFGTSKESDWYRLSIGTCKKEEIPTILKNIETALAQLH